jgi:acetyl-CoA/propionyl-CoA carboxylase biotin carboxyl carrier protein
MARGEAGAAFGNAAVYLERAIVEPRHIEIQILADAHGNAVHLFERECSIQRRHQKVIEEAPGNRISPALRARMGQAAVAAAQAVGYVGAGTCEFLVDKHDDFYFLEMNTRVQVEHTITEAVTGIDSVREQVAIASGEPLSFAQADVVLRGHAIECRVNAEDVAQGFLPSPGLVTAYREPGGIGVRVDSGVAVGSVVSGLYDPLVAKVIVHDVDRERARLRMLRALEEFVVEGPTTLLGFHRALLASPCFVAGETCRGFVESAELAERAWALSAESSARRDGSSSGAVSATRQRAVSVEIDGRRHDIRVHVPEPPWMELARRHRERSKGLTGDASGAVLSPMQGTVLRVDVADGEAVDAGAVVCVVEAMKMENEIVAERSGIVSELAVTVGQQVASGELICVLRRE